MELEPGGDWQVMSMDAFDALVASADPVMIVVTAAADGERAGCLVGFHSQSSIEPRRYAVWLSKANRTYSVAMRASHFGVHFLTYTDLAIAELFGAHSCDDIDKFERLPWEEAAGGVPVLTDLLVERIHGSAAKSGRVPMAAAGRYAAAIRLRVSRGFAFALDRFSWRTRLRGITEGVER